MSKLKRIHFSNQPVFVTVVTYRRIPIFEDETQVLMLRQILGELKKEIPFQNIAWTILPDHFHWIFAPESGGKETMSKVMYNLKRRFSLRCERKGKVWQKRYYDHVIRNEEDLRRHLDYVHFNPVKHGYAATPAKWPASSFEHYRDKHFYPAAWGESEPSEIAGLDYD